MAEGRGLAISALALGIVGLFTGGGLGVGSLVGVALAGVALARTSSPNSDVAWAALTANVFALLTVFPLGGAMVTLQGTATLPPPALEHDGFLPGPGEGPPGSNEPGALAAPPLPASADAFSRTAESTDVAPVPLSSDIERPRKTRHVNPVYPEAARREGVQGAVVLECTISPQGKVVGVKTLQSVPLLDQAAIDAVRQWEYAPTVLNGVVVPVIMTVTVNFRLS